MPKYHQKFYPKAARCRTCSKQHADCSRLPFETMPVHRRDGQDVTVICTQHVSIDRTDPPPQARPAGPSILELARKAREQAQLAGQLKYLGHECEHCGTRERYTKTGRCAECIRLWGFQRRGTAAEAIA